ncbi:NAD(P)-dependent oxidoreductase [Nocardiopsis sp. ATB16-24]|uniref:NAD-dependent epimerase/dehydratase family protein n=1 Tax=Nocardiopsis sp. ATB16-24 TaxID=3019555 RepID=UPI002555DA0F|nr:NAD(P)-dependent oxidoreductase [Nocardiopsis sp. ATB16-24]
MGIASRNDSPECGRPRIAGERVLVLGGTGFLGRHLCTTFRSADARVLLVSRSASGTGRHDTDSIRLDLVAASERDLLALLASTSPSVVVNAAGSVHEASPEKTRAANAEFVERLVRSLSLVSERPRLVHLGSIHEYGAGEVGTSFTEDHPPAPAGVYADSKLRGTRAVLDGVRTTGLVGTALRVGNVVGPGAPRQSLLGAVAHCLAEAAYRPERCAARPRLRLAPLRSRRDFVDARDVAQAVLAAATAPAPSVAGRVINVGSGRAVPVRWTVERMVSISGIPLELVEEPPATARFDPSWQQLDITVARRLLSWRPRLGLEESLSDLLDDARRSYGRKHSGDGGTPSGTGRSHPTPTADHTRD